MEDHDETELICHLVIATLTLLVVLAGGPPEDEPLWIWWLGQ
jgi:hypothetical protein